MTEVGAGPLIYELRKKIQQITYELSELNKISSNMPELIESANLLRTNDHLLEINSKNTELLSAYKQYTEELEKMLDTVFAIQKDLKEILITQTSLISEQKPKKKPKSKKKSPKK
ncbi:MAG: hypothetical protein GTN97_01530 [Nitrosopumilaceae archaeon]|nr:hypothetical protein [Nitrosopumilaceae archaeon]NIP09371.1 hypothetical protein [Nitrosopumilaceae archaeon]NIS94601.1 hypothetical protein [Nitrosopumilaceae archaeon]